VRARGHGAGRRAPCRCVAERATAQKARVLHARAWNRNLKIPREQIAPSPEMRIKRQQTVSSTGCKVLAPNAVFLLASISSYCRFRAIECCYSQSVSVPQDKIRVPAKATVSRSLSPRTNFGNQQYMTCHMTGGFSLPEGARQRSVQLFADNHVARGHLIGQILQMWRRRSQQ